MANVIEHLRRISVEGGFALDSFSVAWPTWKPHIKRILGKNFQATDILDLGDHLSTIFALTGEAGRSQSMVSGGGNAWEALACWYLNLCLIGSRAVAVRKISDLPAPLRDAISVNYGNFKSNTESDIAVIVFPGEPAFQEDLTATLFPTEANQPNFKPLLLSLTEKHFDAFEIGIIQCKTNWNDNAQIPMLWNMIYETRNFRNTSINVGRNNYSIHELVRFTYSFLTVPSNGTGGFKQNSTAVNRVRTLSGGNYWGHETKSGIASSIKEIFNANFRSAFLPSNQRLILKDTLPLLATELRYFDLY